MKLTPKQKAFADEYLICGNATEAESREKTAKTNRTQYVTFKLKAGAENGDVFGINWDNVKSVSGQTYDLRSEIKDRGFRWDGKNKRWVKK